MSIIAIGVAIATALAATRQMSARPAQQLWMRQARAVGAKGRAVRAPSGDTSPFSVARIRVRKACLNRPNLSPIAEHKRSTTDPRGKMIDFRAAVVTTFALTALTILPALAANSSLAELRLSAASLTACPVIVDCVADWLMGPTRS